MAEVKISELPAVTTVATTDTLEVNNGGTSRKATPPQVLAGGIGVGDSASRLQFFVLYVRNNAGTMEHQIVTDGFTWALPNFASKINGATNSYNTTPTGADASTAMAFGGKIGSANTHHFHLDVAAQTAADAMFIASVALNSSGTALTVSPQFQSIDINGVTRMRVRLSFVNAATGAAFPLTTANITSPGTIAVQCLGVLA